MSARQVVLSVGAVAVLLAVIGAVYLEILVQFQATHPAWMVTRPSAAGDLLTADNVKQVSIPEAGDHFRVFAGNPVESHKRLSRSLGAQHLLTDEDVLPSEMVLVPLTLRSAPPLSHGDSIDVYAVVGSKTILIGRNKIVEGAGGSPTIWVPALDEPNWITLQANAVSLFAARSDGTGVPSTGAGQGVAEALSTLSGASVAGAVTTNPSASPLPSPKRSP